MPRETRILAPEVTRVRRTVVIQRRDVDTARRIAHEEGMTIQGVWEKAVRNYDRIREEGGQYTTIDLQGNRTRHVDTSIGSKRAR